MRTPSDARRAQHTEGIGRTVITIIRWWFGLTYLFTGAESVVVLVDEHRRHGHTGDRHPVGDPVEHRSGHQCGAVAYHAPLLTVRQEDPARGEGLAPGLRLGPVEPGRLGSSAGREGQRRG